MITSLVIILDRINREYGASVPQYSGDLTAAGRIVGTSPINIPIPAEANPHSKPYFTARVPQTSGDKNAPRFIPI